MLKIWYFAIENTVDIGKTFHADVIKLSVNVLLNKMMSVLFFQCEILAVREKSLV